MRGGEGREWKDSLHAHAYIYGASVSMLLLASLFDTHLGAAALLRPRRDGRAVRAHPDRTCGETPGADSIKRKRL